MVKANQVKTETRGGHSNDTVGDMEIVNMVYNANPTGVVWKGVFFRFYFTTWKEALNGYVRPLV